MNNIFYGHVPEKNGVYFFWIWIIVVHTFIT
jgi:hypothetical protein